MPVSTLHRKQHFAFVRVNPWCKPTLGWLVVVLLFQAAAVSAANIPVTLQLRWLHQFQFAGYYAAMHKGFYREAGLDVTIRQGGPGVDPVGDVLAGKADFGVSNSSLVIDYLNGKPVLLLGPIFQHSPSILLMRGRVERPVDLAGAGPVALMGGDQDVELKAMFLNEGIPLEKMQFVPDDRHLDDLIEGRVAALYAYLSNEPFTLEQKGIPYSVLRPQTYGMDFYGDALFTRQSLEEARPGVVAAFREASIRGWGYALAHPDEIIELILERYNTQNKSRAHLLFEARTLNNLINPDVIQIGHSNPGRWQHIAETYERFGVVKSARKLDGFFYEPDRKVDLTWYYLYLAIILTGLVVVGGIAFYIHRLNRRLDIRVTERTAELEKAYEELKELDRLKSDFLSTVSHELRTPMTSVIGFAKLTKKKLEKTVFPLVAEDEKAARAISQVRENIDIIIGESERLTLLLNDVLDSAMLEAGKVEWNFVALSPHRLIERAVPVAAPPVEQKGLLLICEIASDLPPLRGDENRLLQVLVNLLANAVKFTERGQITLRAERQGEFVRFSVQDSGCGIAEKDQGKVFDKFKQIGDTLTDKPQGTGLGLSICQRIIQRHGGEIRLDSELGKGSTFSFTVPLAGN